MVCSFLELSEAMPIKSFNSLNTLYFLAIICPNICPKEITRDLFKDLIPKMFTEMSFINTGNNLNVSQNGLGEFILVYSYTMGKFAITENML